MSIRNQNVRSDPTPGNPSGLYPDILAIGNSFTGDGLPDSNNTSGAILGNTYIDRITGIEYKLTQSGWEGFVDFTTIGGGGVIPDPLSINQLNVNTIRGNAGDDVSCDLGTTGNLNITSNGTNGVDINNGEVVLAGNGFCTMRSGIRAYDTLIDNFSGRQLKIESSPEYKIYVPGIADSLNIDNSGQDMNLTARVFNITNSGGVGSRCNILGGPLHMNVNDINSVRNMTGSADQNFLVQAASTNDLVLTSQQGAVQIISINDDISLRANNMNAISVKNNIGAEFVRMDGNTGAEYKMVLSNPVSSNSLSFKAAIGIEKNGTADLNISHLEPNSNIYLRTATGSGIVRVQNAASGNNITLDGLSSTLTANNLSCLSINNSSSLTAVRTVGVSSSGVIQFRSAPRCIVSTLTGFGGNQSSYFDLPGNVAPGQLWGTNVGTNKRITSVLARLHYDSPWDFGSVGNIVMNVGFVPVDTPMVIASFVTLASINIDNGLFYQAGAEDLNIVIPDNAALCARMVLTATNSTSTSAEVSLCVTIE